MAEGGKRQVILPSPLPLHIGEHAANMHLFHNFRLISFGLE